mmetsp:Transcript_43953/g.101712  ORF Transcript_43953/g.101712 Transcript_43953/m.101712 type:complete len:145 (+) Transcript_43953:2-436(+)
MAAVLRSALRALALLALLPPGLATRARGSGVELGAVVAAEREAALFADLCCDWGAAPPATAQRHAPLGAARQKATHSAAAPAEEALLFSEMCCPGMAAAPATPGDGATRTAACETKAKTFCDRAKDCASDPPCLFLLTSQFWPF